jgi:hypothetical protein
LLTTERLGKVVVVQVAKLTAAINAGPRLRYRLAVAITLGAILQRLTADAERRNMVHDGVGFFSGRLS